MLNNFVDSDPLPGMLTLIMHMRLNFAYLILKAKISQFTVHYNSKFSLIQIIDRV